MEPSTWGMSVSKGAEGVRVSAPPRVGGLDGGNAGEGFGGLEEIVSLKWDYPADPSPTSIHTRYKPGPQP